MNGKNMLHALNLKDHSILNDDVETIPTVQLDAFVFDGKRHLPFKGDVTKVEFVAEAFFVRRLEKSRTGSSMDFDRRTDDTLSQFFMKKFAPCLRVSVVIMHLRSICRGGGYGLYYLWGQAEADVFRHHFQFLDVVESLRS